MERPVKRAARWRRLGERLWEGDGSERAYKLAVLTVIVVGLLLRLQGQITVISELWLDEAVWGSRVGIQSPFSHNIRPFGFMWASKLLVNWFGATEFWLRFIPNVSSIIALCLVPLLAGALLRSRVARLLLVIAFAFHPALIDLAKEFKPYSWEVLVHLSFVTLYLRYRQTSRRALLFVLLGALPVSFMFAYNMSFAFPGLLLLALYDGYKTAGLRGAVPAVISGALCLAVTATVYLTLLTKVTTEETESRWGKKYDVFFKPAKAKPAAADRADTAEGAAGEGAVQEVEVAEADVPFANTRTGWLLDKYSDVAALPGLRRELWELPAYLPASLRSAWPMADKIAWVGLHFAALVALILAKRYVELTLLWLPLGCVIVCNAAGVWPMGAFRTNTFLCAYALPLAALGADALIVASKVRAWILASIMSLVYLAPGVAYGHDFSGRKHMWSRHIAATAVLEHIKRLREQQLASDPNAPKLQVLLDLHGLRPLNYYLEVHPESSPKYGKFFRDNVQLKRWNWSRSRFASKLKRQKAGQPLVLVISGGFASARSQLKSFRPRSIELIDHAHLVAMVARKSKD
jgi:hypothetical protein